MALYLLSFLSCIFFVIIYRDKNLKIICNDIVLLGICFLFIFLVGFRYDSGADYWSYYKIFHGINEKNLASEPGFQFLIKFYRMFSHSYNGFVFFIACISIFVKFLFFRKMENPYLALFIYIAIFSFNLEFNAIRQGLAASFVLHAVYFAQKKKLLIYILLIAIASSIHVSSLVFFPLYFFISREFILKINAVFALIVIAFIIRLYLMGNILSVMGLFLENISGISGIGRVVMYLRVTEIPTLELGAIRRIVMCILFVLLNNHIKINNAYFNLYLIGTIIFILFMGNDIISYRLSLVFDIFLIPLLANIKTTYNYRNIFTLALLVILSFTMYWVTLQSKAQNFVPYQTYIL